MRTIFNTLATVWCLLLAGLPLQAHAANKCTDPRTGAVSYTDAPCSGQAQQTPVRTAANVVEGQPTGDARLRAEAQRAGAARSLAQAGVVAAGMTAEESVAVLGAPTRVNIDDYGTGQREQRIYDRGADGTQYVYVERGFVTAVQTRPAIGRGVAARNCHSALEIRNAGVNMNSQRLSDAERAAIRRQVAQMRPCD